MNVIAVMPLRINRRPRRRVHRRYNRRTSSMLIMIVWVVGRTWMGLE